MTFVVKDRVKEQIETEGTGAIACIGRVPSGYTSFYDELADGDTATCVVKDAADRWNTFLGTWNATTKTMARTVVFDGSSGAGVAVSLTGNGYCWISEPAPTSAQQGFNVKMFGAKGDGATDDSVAINAAIAAANAETYGGLVYFPPGLYRVNTAAGNYILPKSNVVMRGAGPGITTIWADSTLNSDHDLVSNNTGGDTYTVMTNFHMSDMTLLGNGQTLFRKFAQQLLRVSGTDMSFVNVESRYSRRFGLVVGFSENVVFDRCKVYRCNGDGIAAWDTPNLIVTNCIIEGAPDDAISSHPLDTQPLPRRNVLISNNVITESQGISALGGKGLIVTNNVLRRCYSTGMKIQSPVAPSSQGQTTMHGVVVAENIIQDVISRASWPRPTNLSHSGLSITNGGIRQAGTGAAPPGEPDPGTGIPVDFYGTNSGNLYANNFGDTDVPAIPAHWMRVSGNTIVRTLPSVTQVSDWGYSDDGLWVGRDSAVDENDTSATGFYNGAVTADDLEFFPMSINRCVWNSVIERNTIQVGHDYGIWMGNNTLTDHMDFSTVIIRDNLIRDCQDACITGPIIPVAKNQRVIVRGNILDADPYFRSDNRTTPLDGSWLTEDYPVCIAMQYSPGWIVTDNLLRNCGKAIRVSSMNNLLYARNIAMCHPVQIGFDVGNKGIGGLSTSENGTIVFFEDSDPTSATYGQLLGGSVVSATAQPTSGYYVRGHTVTNLLVSLAAGKVTWGWIRLTTGNAHVTNTDWSALVIPNT